MVRHHHVDHVLGSPLRHVASGAPGFSGMLSCCDESLKGCRMALAAGSVIFCISPMRLRVGIVAGGALQGIATLQKARRFAQPVSGTGDLEALESVHTLGFKERHKSGERLLRLIREVASSFALEILGGPKTVGLKVALETNLHLPFKRKA